MKGYLVIGFVCTILCIIIGFTVHISRINYLRKKYSMIFDNEANRIKNSFIDIKDNIRYIKDVLPKTFEQDVISLESEYKIFKNNKKDIHLVKRVDTLTNIIRDLLEIDFNKNCSQRIIDKIVKDESGDYAVRSEALKYLGSLQSLKESVDGKGNIYESLSEICMGDKDKEKRIREEAERLQNIISSEQNRRKVIRKNLLKVLVSFEDIGQSISVMERIVKQYELV